MKRHTTDGQHSAAARLAQLSKAKRGRLCTLALLCLALALLCLTLPSCSGSSAGKDASTSRDSNTADAATDAPSRDAASPDGDQPGDGLAEGGSPDTAACQPVTPPQPDRIEACLVRHGPDLIAPAAPTAAEAITLRLETQAGDVQRVYLRVWTGVLRELELSRSVSGPERDVFQAVVPASARPVYYRFRLVDGGATAFLTRGGLRGATPGGADDFFIAPAASGKTLHYATDFAAPEVKVHSGSSVATAALVQGADGLASATGLGSAGQELAFYLHDGASGSEDHPPGGGDYRLPPDLDEGWIFKGTVLDVPPDLLPAELIDSHTHPYERVGTGWTYDPQPLLSLLPAQGITHALTMVSGAPATQQSRLTALHQAHRWVIPLVWVRPQSHAVNEVEALLQSHGFKGLKFHPAVDGFAADAALMDPFMALAAAYQVPVQIHSDTSDASGAARIVALAQRHPQVKVVMIHTALGALDKTDTLALIQTASNVYAETSWTNPQSILQAMTALDSSRTLFGTDATVDGTEQFSKQSIANPQGQYVYTISQVIAEVRAAAHPDAFANWARLTAIRLYDLRFLPEPDLYDTDGDGQPDLTDADDDNDGLPDSSDPAPRRPGA